MTPKTQMSKAEKLKILNKIAIKINEEAKKKVCGFVTDPEIAEKLRIKWIRGASDDVNAATGGGFPKGRMTLIVGMPDSGKTSYMLETIAKNMKEDPNFFAGWLESEESLKKEFICETFGIDPARFFYIQHEKEGAGERALDEIEMVLASGACDMVVINSLKCLVPSEEMRKSATESVVGTQARMNARMTRKFTSIIAEHETSFVVITHLSTDIGSMSRDPNIISGGRAIVFMSQLTLDFRKKAILDTDPINKEDGMKIGVTVRKNHCVPDKNPYLKTEYFAIYGYGVERYLTTLNKALEQGVLTKKGGWISDLGPDGEPREFDGVKLKWQGEKRFREFCSASDTYFKQLCDRVSGVAEMTRDEVAEVKADEDALAPGNDTE
jgi:recombination protein RecA